MAAQDGRGTYSGPPQKQQSKEVVVRVEMELPQAIRESGVTISGRTIQEIEALLWYASQCWSSGMLAEQISSPQKAFFMLLKGTSLGFPAEACWELQYITKAGRVALTKKGALAAVQPKPSYGSYEERIEFEGTPEMRAVAIAERKGQKPTIKEFSLKDAETAGLLKRPRRRDGQGEYDGTYQLYLKDMLLSRAGCRALNVAFAGELAGCLIEGEAEDADDMSERRGDRPAVTTQGAASALQGAAQRLLAPPPKRDPLLAELGAAKANPPEDLVPVTLVDEEPPKTAAVRQVIDQQVEEVFGEEKACPRCKGARNEMGGCDVCGWPGQEDLRG